MRTRTLLGAGGVLFAMAASSLIWSDSRADDKLPVPAAAASKLIDEYTKDIQSAVGAAKMGNKDRKRALVEAVVIAEVANDNAKDAKMAAIRDAALKVADALKKEDAAAAKAAAAGLSKPAAGNAGEPMKLDLAKYIYNDEDKDFDKDLAMHLFKSARAGGLGIETLVKNNSEKAPSGKDVDKSVNAIYTIAALSNVIEQIAPKEKVGAKDPKDWIRFSKALKDSVAEAYDKKKPADMKSAFNKIDASCVGCHNIFKKNN
ncbi:MAG TPA: hypothetical protein VKS79_15940 [Gemmataceae bacterium]|nr:hypothetical protein [Gemmataceae bacterium]